VYDIAQILDFVDGLACEGLDFKSIVVHVDDKQFQHWLSHFGSNRRVQLVHSGFASSPSIDEFVIQTHCGEIRVRKVLFHV